MSIEDRMMECHLLFPAYGERGIKEMKILTRIYRNALGAYSDEQIDDAFTAHVRSKSRFPTVADLIEHLQPVTCYRFNGGPYGYGAIYSRDDPYTRQQARLGVDIAAHAVQVAPADARAAALAAMAAPEPALLTGDEPPARDGARKGGFRRIGYAGGDAMAAQAAAVAAGAKDGGVR